MAKIEEFKKQGCTLIIVSHEASLMQEMCDQVIWLQKGEVRAQGEAESVVDAYLSEMTAAAHRDGGELDDAPASGSRTGSREVEITQMRLTNARGGDTGQIRTGDALTVEMEYAVNARVEGALFSVTIRDEDDSVLCEASSGDANFPERMAEGAGKVTARLDRLDLVAGRIISTSPCSPPIGPMRTITITGTPIPDRR